MSRGSRYQVRWGYMQEHALDVGDDLVWAAWVCHLLRIGYRQSGEKTWSPPELFRPDEIDEGRPNGLSREELDRLAEIEWVDWV